MGARTARCTRVSPIGDVLVGLDGSPSSTRALRWAAWFARSTGRRLHLAHAWQHGKPLGGPLAAAADAAELEAALESSLAALAAEALGAEAAGLVVGCAALRGVVAEALISEAARVDASMIVTAARGAGGARALLGSVSRRLTECPVRTVVVVPDGVDGPEADEPPAGDWRILVGTDGSDGGARAVRWAADTAARSGAEVVVVHAFRPSPPILEHDAAVSAAAEARGRLEVEWCAPLAARGVRYAPLLDDGDPRDVIRTAAASVRPACIVVGSRGLSPFSQRLLGSVTHNLVRQLDHPVVIVPSPRDSVVWQP